MNFQYLLLICNLFFLLFWRWEWDPTMMGRKYLDVDNYTEDDTKSCKIHNKNGRTKKIPRNDESKNTDKPEKADAGIAEVSCDVDSLGQMLGFWQCEVCGGIFKNIAKYNRHRSMHSAEAFQSVYTAGKPDRQSPSSQGHPISYEKAGWKIIKRKMKKVHFDPVATVIDDNTT